MGRVKVDDKLWRRPCFFHVFHFGLELLVQEQERQGGIIIVSVDFINARDGIVWTATISLEAAGVRRDHVGYYIPPDLLSDLYGQEVQGRWGHR